MNCRILIVLLLGAMAGLSGCSPHSNNTSFAGTPPPAPTSITLMAIDWSKSTLSIRKQLIRTAYDIGTNFNPKHDTMRLYRFGNKTEEVYSGLPEDEEGFARVLKPEVKASDPVEKTNYSLMLKSLANDAANDPEARIRVIIIGDGENDYAGDAKYDTEYRAAAVQLAHNPKVEWVRYWGVDIGTREEIRSVCRPLGNRLQILSLDQNPLAP